MDLNVGVLPAPGVSSFHLPLSSTLEVLHGWIPLAVGGESALPLVCVTARFAVIILKCIISKFVSENA